MIMVYKDATYNYLYIYMVYQQCLVTVFCIHRLLIVHFRVWLYTIYM